MTRIGTAKRKTAVDREYAKNLRLAGLERELKSTRAGLLRLVEALWRIGIPDDQDLELKAIGDELRNAG